MLNIEFLVFEKNVGKSIPSSPSILYLPYTPPNAPSINLGVRSNNCIFSASLLAIKFLLVLPPPLILLIFLFRSSIFLFILLFGLGCIGCLDSNSSNFTNCSHVLSAILVASRIFSAILVASRFIERIFVLLNLALVLLDALVILSSTSSFWYLRSLISILNS